MMSYIACPAGGHEAGSQPDTCSSCEWGNAFVEQLTQVLVNREIDALPNSQADPLVKQLVKGVVSQEIIELSERRKKAE